MAQAFEIRPQKRLAQFIKKESRPRLSYTKNTNDMYLHVCSENHIW